MMESLRDWALEMLGIDDANEQAATTPTRAALRFAVDVIDVVNHTRYVDEETLTGMFLGSLLSQLSWTTLAFAAPGDRSDACYWSHYSKHGRDEFAESRLGADFALVLPYGPGQVKVAVFQAKREIPDSRGRINIGQSRSNKKGDVFRQYDLLRHHGQLIERDLAMAHGGHTPKESMNWIHYLGYMKDGLVCRSMSSMGTFKSSVAKNTGYVPVPMSAFVVPFLDLLTLSTLETGNGFFGWLPMTILQAQAMLPEFLELSDIYFIGDESIGPRPLLKNLAAFERSSHTFAAAPAPFRLASVYPKPVVPLPGVARKRSIGGL